MKRCIACGAPPWETPLLTLDNVPASAQRVPDVTGLLKDQGLTLDLHQCMGCGLVQFGCDPVGYYRDVIQAGGSSKTMVELRRYQYKNLIQNYHLEGKGFIEVGCGQGEFLKVLTELSVEAHGIGHNPHLMELTRTQGLNVMEGFAETEDTRFPGGLYDVFLSFDSLEYQPDPDTMLQAICHNLEDDVMGLITIPSFEYIMDHSSYLELIRNHIAYYTFETLTPLLEHSGFQAEECEITNGDTLFVMVKRRPQTDTESLLDCYVNLREEMESYMKYLDAWDKKIAMWGTGHQGFTLAVTTKLGDRAQYIIDSASFKHGRSTSSPHLPIVPPEYFLDHPVDVIIVTTSGYTEEIAASIRGRFDKDMEVRAIRFSRLELVE